MNYITTYTGKHFDPTNPDSDLIEIVDIAHSLSLMCRGNGHVKNFFSVGQHCINCALEAKERDCSKRLILACLLHDASEAYMSDVPRPFKKTLLDYQKSENILLDVIYRKFLGSTLSDIEKNIVKQIDDEMLYFDLLYLLNDKPDTPEPIMKTRFSYEYVPFEIIENKYLELFNLYYK